MVITIFLLVRQQLERLDQVVTQPQKVLRALRAALPISCWVISIRICASTSRTPPVAMLLSVVAVSVSR